MPYGASKRPITTISRSEKASGRGVVRGIALASAARRGLWRACLLDQAGDGIGELGALVLPVIDAIQRKPQRLLALRSDRIVEADALDESTVATIARVGYDDIE